MPKQIIFLLFILSQVLASPAISRAQSNQTESLTITTYYPSPYGVYHNLEVKRGLAVGDITKGPLKSMNNLTSGQLYINNSVVLNSLSSYPPQPWHTGQVIYYSPDKMLKFFNSTAWVNATGNDDFIIIPPSGSCPSGYARINHWLAATIGGGCQESHCTSIGPPAEFSCNCADDTCLTPAQWSDVAPSCNYVHKYTFGCVYMNMASGSASNFDKSGCIKNY